MDFCVTSLQSRQGRIPRDPPGVQGHRLVRRVYTLDARPSQRLGELAQALAAVGWGQIVAREKTTAMADLAQRHPPVGDFSWRPVAGFGLPPGLELQPPARQWPTWRGIGLAVDWGAPLSAEASGTRGTPRRPAQNTPIHRLLERAAIGTPEAAPGGRVPSIAIEIDYLYYNNTNISHAPGRLLVRSLIPVRRARGWR